MLLQHLQACAQGAAACDLLCHTGAYQAPTSPSHKQLCQLVYHLAKKGTHGGPNS